MAGLIVLTHGGLAEELVRAAEKIHGKTVERMMGLSIGWDDDVEAVRARVEEAVRKLAPPDGQVLILTDLFGGTCSNIAHSLLESGKIEVVTGVNLPMVLKFTNLRAAADFSEIAQRIAAQGRGAIQVASDVLEGRETRDAGEGA